VKLLVDASAGRQLARNLASLGHNVVFSRDLGPDPGDVELLKIAAEKGRTIVTVDRNFARPVLFGEAPSIGIIFIPDARLNLRQQLVNSAIERHEQDLNAGAWVVSRPGQMRLRKPQPEGDE
jgi:predicted nuclease of predicted toxin-antitoxin system